MTATKDGVYFGLYCYLVEGDETLVGGITWWGFFLVGGMSSFSASVGKWGGGVPPPGEVSKCPPLPNLSRENQIYECCSTVSRATEPLQGHSLLFTT